MHRYLNFSPFKDASDKYHQEFVTKSKTILFYDLVPRKLVKLGYLF